MENLHLKKHKHSNVGKSLSYSYCWATRQTGNKTVHGDWRHLLLYCLNIKEPLSYILSTTKTYEHSYTIHQLYSLIFWMHEDLSLWSEKPSRRIRILCRVGIFNQSVNVLGSTTGTWWMISFCLENDWLLWLSFKLMSINRPPTPHLGRNSLPS